MIFVENYAIQADGKAVYQLCDNTKAALREVADKKKLTIDASWTTRQLGANVIKALGGSNPAVSGDYVVVKNSEGSVQAFKKCKDEKVVLRGLADKIGCAYADKDSAETLASKIAAYMANDGKNPIVNSSDESKTDKSKEAEKPKNTEKKEIGTPNDDVQSDKNAKSKKEGGKKKLIIVSPVTLYILFTDIDKDYYNEVLTAIEAGDNELAYDLVESYDLEKDAEWSLADYYDPKIYDADNIVIDRKLYVAVSFEDFTYGGKTILGKPLRKVGIWSTDGKKDVPIGLPKEMIANLCDWANKGKYNKDIVALGQNFPFEEYGGDKCFIFRMTVDVKHPVFYECEIDLNGRPFDQNKLFFFQCINKCPRWVECSSMINGSNKMVLFKGLVYDGQYYPFKDSLLFEDGYYNEELTYGIIKGDMNFGDIHYYDYSEWNELGVVYEDKKLYQADKTKKKCVIRQGTVEIGEDAFSNCDSLEKVTIPETVTDIGESAFNGCSALKEIYIPSSVVKIGDGVFSGCDIQNLTLESKEFSTDGVCLFDANKHILISCYKKYVENYAIPDTVKTIGESAFNGCSALKDINIPSSVESIGGCAFSGCAALKSVTIPESVKSIDYYAFSDCTALKSVTIPSSFTKIADCGSAFVSTPALGKIYIPKGTMSKFKKLFYGREDKLTEV